MVSTPTKNIILGNVQLIKYCEDQHIDLKKLSNCNIEKMGNTYFFVLPKKNVRPVLENDIESQPDVVLTMDVSKTDFHFASTEWTEKVFC